MASGAGGILKSGSFKQSEHLRAVPVHRRLVFWRRAVFGGGRHHRDLCFPSRRVGQQQAAEEGWWWRGERGRGVCSRVRSAEGERKKNGRSWAEATKSSSSAAAAAAAAAHRAAAQVVARVPALHVPPVLEIGAVALRRNRRRARRDEQRDRLRKSHAAGGILI